MIAVLDKNCPLKLKADIVRVVEGAGFRVQVSEHDHARLVGVIGPGAESLAVRPVIEGVSYMTRYTASPMRSSSNARMGRRWIRSKRRDR